MITSNLAKQNDVIKYKGNTLLAHDEKMSPMLEDIVLLDAVREIDVRLPAYVRTFYTHKMSKTDILMDFKNDILNNVPKFLQELDNNEHLHAKTPDDADPTMAAFRQRPRGQGLRGETFFQEMNKVDFFSIIFSLHTSTWKAVQK